MTALRRLEDLVASTALLALVALPLLEIAVRGVFGVGIPGSGPFVQHLTLWVGFLGAALAARERKLLALATGTFIPDGPWRTAAAAVSSTIAACVATILAMAAVELVISEREAGTTIAAGLPVWVGQVVLPVAYALIAGRLAWQAGSWNARGAALVGIGLGYWLGGHPLVLEGRAAWPWVGVLIGAGVLGAPIFTVLGGAAAFLFMTDGITPAILAIETYGLSVSPTLPAIPLFTLAGFLLAEGLASQRLLRLFRSGFGWIPGGTAVVCAALCTFFTVFTGGSGVTILALGGLLFPALLKEGYRDRFSLGLLTASGSLGLLLPPALPLILFGIVAEIPIENLFIGGVLPGLLLTSLIGAWGVREGIVTGAGRQPFVLGEVWAALWEAKWEIAMPMVVLIAIFSGWATLVEASALTALYALVAQVIVHRDLSIRRDLLRVVTECITLVGGVLIILGVAVGLTSYMVDAQVPMRLVAWAQEAIASPLVFLLALNVFLLIVGGLMDIFSAIVVVVPLILPLGQAFGIHPVHLGIIFIANLELGYLTPPVGLNLFLASYRFKRPLLEVCVAALPMLGILGVGVLLITYVPWLTLAILEALGRL